MYQALLEVAVWAAVSAVGFYILGGLTGRWLWRHLTDLLDGPPRAPSGGAVEQPPPPASRPSGGSTSLFEEDWYLHLPDMSGHERR